MSFLDDVLTAINEFEKVDRLAASFTPSSLDLFTEAELEAALKQKRQRQEKLNNRAAQIESKLTLYFVPGTKIKVDLAMTTNKHAVAEITTPDGKKGIVSLETDVLNSPWFS